MSDAALTPQEKEALLRWRLALGKGAEDTDRRFGIAGLEGAGEALGIGGQCGDIDDVLGAIYGDDKKGGVGTRAWVPKWLGMLRDLFQGETVALVQKDAIEKKGLTQLLFEPETLPYLEKNVDLVTTLMSAQGLIPDEAKQIARGIVKEVVEELRKKLESETRTSILGAVKRGTNSPLRIARNLDWKKTIEKNLKGWDGEKKRLVPDRFYFWSNQRRHHEWDVVLVVDQSGSMGQSVVYSSVMAAIFASLDVLKTRLLFFDTEILDMTPVLVDPIEVLFGARLGGGTDINRAVAYASENFIERPSKTLFILITDLYEGGNRDELMMRMRRLVESRVKAICLLALTDGGKPSYDHENAQQLESFGVPCFGATPKMLVQIMERLMKGQDIRQLVNEAHAGGKR